VPLFEAWLALPDPQRRAMDADLRDIFSLSSEKGVQAIIDEADWHLSADSAKRDAVVEHLSTLNSHFERAMVTFLDYPGFWRGALHFHHADTLCAWYKRLDLPRTTAAADIESRDELARRISEHFHRTEGRGKHCIVELFRRGDRDYYFAYPEDYSQQSIEWEGDQFARRPHNPAFEIIFVYSQRDGSLDLHCRGAYKSVTPLQAIFAEVILKTPGLGPAPRDERVYELNRLQSPRFEFVYDTADGIRDVRVKKLRLSSSRVKGKRVTFEADAVSDRLAVYQMLSDVEPDLPLRDYNVTQVELAVTVDGPAGKPPKHATVRITHPNSCSLKYDELDLKLRKMLRDSGIEPGEPGAAEESDEVPEAAGA
jgi:hypothetical protein